MFKEICIFTIIVFSYGGMLQLREQIQNTEQLIYLYQQKLRILKDIYESNYPDVPNQNLWIPERKNLTLISKSSAQLALISKFEYPSLVFQDKYLLANNQVIDMATRQTIAQFMGDVLIVEDVVITTLVGGKINMLAFKHEEGTVKKEENFLGLSGDKLGSIWHRNYNIKDGQDLLVQWHQNKIYFRGKDVNTIVLSQDQSQRILSIYSLNQYKIIVISTHKIGIINSRSQQIGQFQLAKNMTRIKSNSSEEVRIVQSYKQDGFIFLLLSTGELAKYQNQKIVNIQLLPALFQHYNLYQNSLQLDYVHPYLFIANCDLSTIKVYINQMNRFQQTLYINVHLSHPTFSFYKQHDSYRAIISTSNQTKIYEILLPIVQEAVISTNYFKFIGIFVVVICFVYLKWFKKGDDDQIGRKQLIRKYQMERARAPPQDRAQPGKQKTRLNHSEIQQFLKKQSREYSKKTN